MKRFITLLIFCLWYSHSNAAIEPQAAEKMPLAEKSLLLDIIETSAKKLVAVGERGHVLVSNDGKQWIQADVPVQSTLTAVYFVGTKGWAVGHDSTIIATNDGGLNWQIQQFLPASEKPLLDILFKNKLEGIAIGAYGQFYRTTDGGKHWQFEFHSEFLHPDDVQYLAELKAEDEAAYLDERSAILPHFNRLYQDGRTLYMVGEIGLIAKSNDFGKSWQKLDEIYTGSFFDVARTQQGNLLVVGLRGHVFRSLRNGTPWQDINTHSTALINSIVTAGENKLLLLGTNGALFVSDDDGQSFKLKAQPDGKALIAGVWFNNKLIAVSDVGIKSIQVK